VESTEGMDLPQDTQGTEWALEFEHGNDLVNFGAVHYRRASRRNRVPPRVR
ncbi:MAG: hypothetical protein QOG92_2154, partial [Verrucomicrobiota bacterium]|nr:hypothetical protein [Verrucomicrobiota bacterium]